MAGILNKLLVIIGGDSAPLDRETQKATRTVQKLADDMATVGARLSVAFTAPLTLIGEQSIKATAQMESAMTAFTTMMGSAAAASRHIDELKQFALATPFQFTELTDASRKMQALGFSADSVVPKLRIIGNAVSALGGGKEALDRVILSLGQMNARGHITGEELREMAHSAIPALDAIAKKLGITTEEAQRRIKDGAVSSQVAMEAILGYMETRFAGGMEAQSKTLGGIFSNLQDALGFAAADIGKTLAPAAKYLMTEAILPLLNTVKNLAHEFGELPAPVQAGAIGITAVVAAIGPLLYIGGSLINTMVLLNKNWEMFTGLVRSAGGAISGSLGLYTALGASVVYLLDKLYEYRSAVGAADYAQKQAERSLDVLVIKLRQDGVTAVNELVHSFDHGLISQEEFRKGVFALAIEHGKTVKATDEHKGALERIAPAAEVVKLHFMGLMDTMSAIAHSHALEKMESDLFKVMDAAKSVPGLIPLPGRDLSRPETPLPPVEDILRTPTPLPELRTIDIIYDNINKNAKEIVRQQGIWTDVTIHRTRPALFSLQGAWMQLGRSLRQIFDGVAAKLADLIIQGGKFKDVMVSIFKDIGHAILTFVIKAGLVILMNWLINIIDKMRTMGGILGGIGSILTTIFSKIGQILNGKNLIGSLIGGFSGGGFGGFGGYRPPWWDIGGGYDPFPGGGGGWDPWGGWNPYEGLSFGGGGAQTMNITVPVYVDGKQVASSVVRQIKLANR